MAILIPFPAACIKCLCKSLHVKKAYVQHSEFRDTTELEKERFNWIFIYFRGPLRANHIYTYTLVIITNRGILQHY